MLEQRRNKIDGSKEIELIEVMKEVENEREKLMTPICSLYPLYL
jgi:hypothetical protein